MTLFGFSLVFAAACCHATWNYFLKRINGGIALVWLFSLITVFIYLPLAAYVVITERPVFGIQEYGFIVGSALLHLAYFLLLQTCYRKGDLSLIYPTARATGPFISTIFAVILLGVVITTQIAVGAFIIVVGVVCLTGGFKSGAKNLAASLFFGAGAGFFIGSYTAWDAYAVSVLIIPPLLLDYASSLGRAVFLAPAALRRKEQVLVLWREHRTGVIAIAIFNPLAYILVLYALTFTPVVYVAPTREIGVLLAVLMGSMLLGEGDLKRRLSWATVIMCGVALLASA